MNTKIFDQLLTSMDIQPVLMDVGASGGHHQIWNAVAPHSVYVGFDPDERDIRELPDSAFKRAVIVNKAVVADHNADSVAFFLTHSPYCSSTLEPDRESLANYSFAPRFDVINIQTVPAITLNAVVGELSLSHIDWIKTDSQGTDLRLWQSLDDSYRDQVLAIEIEPGLIDAYKGEDLWIDAQQELTRQGFWLSDLDVKGVVRIQETTLETLSSMGFAMDEAKARGHIQSSPGWMEARYLRSLDWLAAHEASPRQYVLLWTFAIIDGQKGFALDVALAYKRLFGADEVADVMVNEAVRLLRTPLIPRWRRLTPTRLYNGVLRRVRKGVRG